jgi:hypothetical protein
MAHFKDPEASLLYKRSSLAAALRVTKFTPVTVVHLVTLFMLLKSDLPNSEPRGWTVEQSSQLAAVLGVTVTAKYLATLCCTA